MLQIIGLIVVVLAIGAAVYYFGFYKRGKINDRDGDYIPDEVEDVKDGVKEVKRRAKNVKKELKDVVEAAKEVGNQVGDVAKAAKGRKRQGRRKKK